MIVVSPERHRMMRILMNCVKENYVLIYISARTISKGRASRTTSYKKYIFVTKSLSSYYETSTRLVMSMECMNRQVWRKDSTNHLLYYYGKGPSYFFFSMLLNITLGICIVLTRTMFIFIDTLQKIGRHQRFVKNHLRNRSFQV